MPIKINGATSGSTTIAAPATGSDETIVLSTALASKGDISTNGAWTSYTPTLTNITLGNGTLVASYVQIGKTVHMRLRLTFGSTTSISGTPSFSLPVTNAAIGGGIGGATALITDAGATFPNAAPAVVGTNIVTVRYFNIVSSVAYASDINATTPWTWATGDLIDVSATYEAA